MTVLGNIVAVTSIVTVVSLIQGVNAMVVERHRDRRRRRLVHDPARAPRATLTEDEEERDAEQPAPDGDGG